MKYALLTTLAICLVFGMTDDGNAFRCGKEVISVGDSVSSLSAKCGRPMRKEFAAEKFQDRWESVEKWSYNCGEKDFIYVLTIVHSRITAEESVGRGTGASECGGR